MQRRDFLQATGAGLATLLARPTWASSTSSPYLKTLGLQLYTLRNQLADDVPGTIKAVADAGYYQVELMRVVGEEPIFKAARDHGLKVTSAMIDWKTLVSPGEPGVPSFRETLDVAVEEKLKYLVIPYVGKGHRETADQLNLLARRANRAGEACRKAGIQLCYHHHSFEFARLPDGATGWDVFVREFDPDLVKFEIDVFWAAIGGFDPVETIRWLKGRVAQLHLKDLLKGTLRLRRPVHAIFATPFTPWISDSKCYSHKRLAVQTVRGVRRSTGARVDGKKYIFVKFHMANHATVA